MREELRAPSAAGEDNGHLLLADGGAHLSQQIGESLGEGGVELTGDQQQRIAGAIVDPVVGGGRHRQMAPGHESLGNRVSAMLGSQTSELAPQGLDLRRPIEPEEPPEGGRVVLLELLGTLDAQQRHQEQCHECGAQSIEGRPDPAVKLACDAQQPAVHQVRHRQ